MRFLFNARFTFKVITRNCTWLLDDLMYVVCNHLRVLDIEFFIFLLRLLAVNLKRMHTPLKQIDIPPHNTICVVILLRQINLIDWG